MALKLRKKSKQHLDKQSAEIIDTSSNSKEYFGVIDFPTYLGEGKNSFRIKPQAGSLKPNSRIDIEVLDRNGNPIYHEIPNFTQSDRSRLISIYVYDGVDEEYETPAGTARVIIKGTSVDGRSIRWSRDVEVNTSIQSNSTLVFNTTNLPRGSVSSSVQTFVNISQTNGELTQTTQSSDVKYIKSIYGDDVSFEISDSTNTNAEMVGGTIEVDFSSVTLFPRLTNQSQPTSYTSSITGVITNKILRVENAVTQSDNRRKNSIHTYETSDSVSATIKYFSTGSNVTTQNQVALANLTLSNVDPIVGRVHSTNTLIKSQGLTNSDFELLANTLVENEDTIEYSVPIPTEHLNDPKTIKIQFVNVDGVVSSTEVIVENIIFTGGNVYIGGNQSIVTGSLFISNAIGSGLEIGGHSSGFLKSVGYDGVTDAASGAGPGGFVIYSGSGALQMGSDVLEGVGMQFVGDNDDRHLIFSTANGGELDIKTDKFFIGTTGSQFISGSDSNIEISSSQFHLDPKNDRLVIGADAIIEADLSVNNIRTPSTIGGVPSTDLNASSSIKSDGFARFVSASIGGFNVSDNQINSTNDLLILKSNGQITASEVNLSGDITAEIGRFDDVNVVGVIAKDSSNNYLLETWVTSSSDIDSTYAYGGSLVNVGSTGTEFSYGTFTWTVGGSDLSNTVISASKFSRGILSSETQLPDPPTFNQWVDVKGGAESIDVAGIPFGYPEEYGSVDKSVESVAFKVGGVGIGNANWIRSETITLPTSEMGDDVITGYTLQTAIKFGPSFGGYNPTLRVEILKPDNTVLKRAEYTSRNAGEWLNITLPITDALIEIGSTSLDVSNQFRIKLSSYVGSSSGGGVVQYIRFTELRILKSPSLETVFAKGLQFEQSSLQPAKLGTSHHGNFIPGRDNIYDLGQVQDTSMGRETSRWDDIYATNGTIQTSDESEKTNVVSSDLGLSFVNDLRPVSYKWVGKTRTHYGLIAQEVSSSLGMFGKTTDDFAGVTTGSLMGLRYSEMLSPMIKAIQELSDEVNQLKLQLSQSQG